MAIYRRIRKEIKIYGDDVEAKTLKEARQLFKDKKIMTDVFLNEETIIKHKISDVTKEYLDADF